MQHNIIIKIYKLEKTGTKQFNHAFIVNNYYVFIFNISKLKDKKKKLYDDFHLQAFTVKLLIYLNYKAVNTCMHIYLLIIDSYLIYFFLSFRIIIYWYAWVDFKHL